MNDYGITITKKGINFPAQGKDLIYTSKRDTLKYLPSYADTVEYTDGSDVEITHNLGYTPGFLCWRKLGSPAKWAVDALDGALRTDSTKLYIPGVASGSKVHYIILVNPVVGGPLPVIVGNGSGMKATTRSINVASMNALDLSFYSEYAHLYTVKEVVSEYTIPASLGEDVADGPVYVHTLLYEESYEHELGYTPGFISFFNIDSGDSVMNPYLTDISTIITRVDATHIYYEFALYIIDMEPTYDFADVGLKITTKLLGVKLE